MTLGIYSVATDISVCPGVDSASKNEYQDIPGGKGGRCVRVTTLPPSCAECLVSWSLNRPGPSRSHRPVLGVALPLYKLIYKINFTCTKIYTHQAFLSFLLFSMCCSCYQQGALWEAFKLLTTKFRT